MLFLFSGVAVDRVIAIQKPFQYKRLIHPVRVHAICIIFILYSIVLTLPSVLWWSTWNDEAGCRMLDMFDLSYLLILVVHVLVVIVILISIYTIIFNTANKHITMIQNRRNGNTLYSCSSRKQSVLSNASSISNSRRDSTVSLSSIGKVALHIERTNKLLIRKLQQMTKDTKASRTLACVVGVYSLCYAPFIIIVIIASSTTYHGPIIYMVAFLSITSIRFNSAINPFIYAIKLPEFRYAIKKMLHMEISTNNYIKD